MERKKGFVVPFVALGLLIVAGGLLYTYSRRGQTTTQIVTGNHTAPATTAGGISTAMNLNNRTSAVFPSANTSVDSTIISSQNNQDLVEVSSQGVMPQRLRWKTYTSGLMSYAISYPPSWVLSGADSLVYITDGRAVVSVQASNILVGTTVNAFAAQDGVSGGLSTIKVNAYNALQTIGGANTVYYLVNGAVGYKISVSNSLSSEEAEIVRAILIEFTVTRQR